MNPSTHSDLPSNYPHHLRTYSIPNDPERAAHKSTLSALPTPPSVSTPTSDHNPNEKNARPSNAHSRAQFLSGLLRSSHTESESSLLLDYFSSSDDPGAIPVVARAPSTTFAAGVPMPPHSAGLSGDAPTNDESFLSNIPGLSRGLSRPLAAAERGKLAHLDKLKFFLATAPSQRDIAHPTQSTSVGSSTGWVATGNGASAAAGADAYARGTHPFLNRFMLPSYEFVTCVLWNGLYHITGTDIVRALVFRFEAFGRPVRNLRQFEEGIFSDLRNLKPGVDACLEEPKSPLLNLLFKYQCIHTQKKQKVFYWFSVPHDRLLLDALERDLKREKMGLEPTTHVVGEPALSFIYDPKRSLYEQFGSPMYKQGRKKNPVASSLRVSESHVPQLRVRPENLSSITLEPQLQKATKGDPTADPEPPSVLLPTSRRSSPIGEPPTVSPLSNSVAISEAAAEDIWRLLAMVLNNRSAYKALLLLKGEKAQVMLDIMHKALDSRDIPVKLGHAARYAIMRLCTASGIYPRCLALQEIRYEVRPVASGAFGDIWKGYHGDHPVCLKVARVYQGSDVEHLIKIYMREAIMWSHLSHPNLLPFYGIYQVDDRLGRVCLVSPWMQNGNVNEYLKTHPEAPRLPLVHDILGGLRYLHKQNVVHGDLKGANILISSTGSACLADFGLSSMVDSEILRWTSLKTMTRVGGTVRWQAPELMDDLDDDGSRPTFAADVYSVASVMYEVFTDQLPFFEIRNDMTVMLRAMKGLRPTRPSLDQALELSAEIWEVMESCWSHNPAERPSADQAAERVSRVHGTEPMASQINIQKIQQKQDVVADALTPSSFRAAMRGQNTNFSKAEIDILQEYAGHSLQSIFDLNGSPPGFDDRDVNIPDLLDTAVAQMEMGPDLGTSPIPPGGTDTSNILNESQAALEAVPLAAGSVERDASPESGEVNEALAEDQRPSDTILSPPPSSAFDLDFNSSPPNEVPPSSESKDGRIQPAPAATSSDDAHPSRTGTPDPKSGPEGERTPSQYFQRLARRISLTTRRQSSSLIPNLPGLGRDSRRVASVGLSLDTTCATESAKRDDKGKMK